MGIAKQNLLGELDDKINFQIASGRIWLTMGLFILGLYIGRKKVFENLVEHLPLVRRIFKYCAWSIVVSLLIVAVIMGIYQGNPPQAPWLMLLGGTIFDAANVTLPFLYIAGVILLFQKAKWEKILLWLYPVGKNELNNLCNASRYWNFYFLRLRFRPHRQVRQCFFVAHGFGNLRCTDSTQPMVA